MKKVLFLIAFLVNAVLAMAQFPGSGTGTKDDPYLILNSDQLYSVRNFLGKENVYFSILNDIDVSDYAYGSGWEPIGNNSSSFCGIIDGNGNKITGLVINRQTKDYVALFGYTDGATIKNLIVEGSVSGQNYVGGIVGYSREETSFENVYFEGNLTGHNYVGGLVGESISFGDVKTNIRCCGFSGTISGVDYIGGIVGQGSNYGSPSIQKCSVEAIISANQKVGGITGYFYGNTIQDCSVNITISSTSNEVGGIAGYAWYGEIKRCSVNGNIVAIGDYVGGLLGRGVDGNYSTHDVTDSYFIGHIKAHDYVGGIIGGSSYNIKSCYVKGTVIGHDKIGGISGGYSGNVTSNVSICSLIESETTNTGRIIPSMSTSKCYSLFTTKILTSGLPISEEEIENNTSIHGTNIIEKNLKMSTFYQGLSWNFGTTWNIIDTESFPYLQTQTAPPVIQSSLACGETTISGNSVDGGSVKVIVDGKEYTAATVNNKWSVTVPALQAGATVIARASAEGLFPSYNVEKYVSYQGNGTEDDPYLVNTCSDLMNIHGDGYYKLTSDIDLAEASSDGWQPLGECNEAISHLDGDNHKITNLYISQEDDKVGLFANLTGATIKNLTIETAQDKNVQGKDMVGVLAGRLNNCTIENVTIKGDVKGNSYVGGLAGQINGGSIENVSVVSTSVTGKNLVGGIAGTSSATINLCKFEGDVTDNVVANDGIKSGTIVYVGGIAATSEGTISQTYSVGAVTATRVGSKAGGLVGDNYAAITNSYSTADVNGDTYATGIAADNHAKVEKCYAAGNITATNSSAKTFSSGIVGYNDGGTAVVSQCAAMNKYVISTSDVGNVFRVIGGIKNSAPIPGNTNYAMENMILSVNGIRKIQGDDVFNGYMRADEMFKTQSLFENNGWDFSDVWKISENTSYPMLQKLSAEPNTSIDILVNSISLSKASAILTVGETLEISATITPDDAANKSVVWSSSNDNVANVSDNGVVTAIAEGTATITATAADGSGVTETCEVTVKAVQSGSGTVDVTPRPTSGNYMYVEKQIVKPGQAVQIPVELVVDELYEEEIVGFQCNIKLPEGFDFVKNSKGNAVITLNQDRIDGHSVTSMLKADGTLNIGCASMSLGAFTDLDGAIMYVSVMAKEGMADGEYAMQISNVRLSTEDEEIQCPTITQALEVKNFTLGDLNDDGDWTILDVTLTIKHMLEETYTEAGDMNEDGSITILDVTKVIQYMLNEGPVEAASAPAAKKMAKVAAKDSQKLYAENLYIEPGTQQTLTVNAHLNTEDYVGCQLEMQLPEGFSYVTNKKGAVVVTPNSYRCETHSASVKLVDSRTLRIGIASMSLDPIYFGEDGDEALFTVKVQADASVEAGNHEISITKVRFSTEEVEDQFAATEGYFRAFGEEAISLVVPEGGYATLCLPYNATVPAGLKAYKATGVKNGMVVVEEQTSIAACTPMIIEGTAGTYNFSGDNSDADEFEYSVGSLKSSLIPAESNNGYVLQNLSEGLGFYKIADALTVPSFRCVLDGASVSAAPAFVPVGFEEDANAIETIGNKPQTTDSVYTLDGKRVKTMEKGKIYIVGGVKMIVK